eukprot:1659173-Rhodomonas_salina.1
MTPRSDSASGFSRVARVDLRRVRVCGTVSMSPGQCNRAVRDTVEQVRVAFRHSDHDDDDDSLHDVAGASALGLPDVAWLHPHATNASA